MSNLRLCYRNFLDEATVTASEADTEFPVSNTQNDGREDAWRSTTTGSVTMSWTWTRDRVFNFWSFWYHRNHGGNVQVELFSDPAWATPASGGDTGTLPWNKVVGSASDVAFASGDDPYGLGQYDPLIGESPWWYYFAAPVTARSAKATFSSHSTTVWNDAFWHIARPFAGKYWSPRVNPSYDGHGLKWADNTTSKRTLAGTLDTNVGARWPETTMRFEAIDEDEEPVLLNAQATCQTGRAIFISLFPEDGTIKERNNMVLGKLSSLGMLGRQVQRITNTMEVKGL